MYFLQVTGERNNKNSARENRNGVAPACRHHAGLPRWYDFAVKRQNKS